MRNRTELVTTTLPGSENEEDASDLDDSEEDWKPAEKKVSNGMILKKKHVTLFYNNKNSFSNTLCFIVFLCFFSFIFSPLFIMLMR